MTFYFGIGVKFSKKRWLGKMFVHRQKQLICTYFDVQAFRRFYVLCKVQPLLSSYWPHVGSQRLFVATEPLHLQTLTVIAQAKLNSQCWKTGPQWARSLFVLSDHCSQAGSCQSKVNASCSKGKNCPRGGAIWIQGRTHVANVSSSVHWSWGSIWKQCVKT